MYSGDSGDLGYSGDSGASGDLGDWCTQFSRVIQVNGGDSGDKGEGVARILCTGALQCIGVCAVGMQEMMSRVLVCWLSNGDWLSMAEACCFVPSKLPEGTGRTEARDRLE